ncbi:cobalt-precorrin 5B C1-methyltransferase [Natranaerovirga hydrolytica]|uniref:Cobalt-precorrin-5B C(1)-methyltransferase n=1 Tax=Natranaerovirga hydrolytica TaxID=680378 RepID=A0A4R1N6K2_9FIRM|nr:cobalt-precorrin-5B (C(1))-methyltransferase CbiD [Natranaerovirga hydrolytica]TCK98659.1 cobalt-precorrin 5B C1-methyltransferase [Natranaerovirga hydrolytica]
MNNARYIYTNGKRLRTGYTTGSCATAAAKAATWMLKNQKICHSIKILTPKGWTLTLDVKRPYFDKEKASCYVIKDSGDDPDITNGMAVMATVTLQKENKVTVVGGQGVGKVTQKGLSIPVGEWAINPVPREMIQNAVRSLYDPPQGVYVIIDLPEGERLAKRTFNPKLGIIGGLSILGTTGIVEPMSEDALKETIVLELKMLKEKGYTTLALVPGSIGEKLLHTHFNYTNKNCIKVSNYIGHALEQATDLGFQEVIIAGHMGKLIKLSGGTFYTHNRISRTRMEILTAHLGIMGMKQDNLQQVMACKTTDEVLDIVEQAGFLSVYKLLANKAAEQCREYVFDQMNIEIAFFSMTQLISTSDAFDQTIERINHEYN